MVVAQTNKASYRAGITRSITKWTKNLENFCSLEILTFQIGFKTTNIIPRRLLRRPEWFIVEYPCQSGFFEGGHWLTLSWLHGQSRLKSGYFVSYLTYVSQMKVLNSHGAGYRFS